MEELLRKCPWASAEVHGFRPADSSLSAGRPDYLHQTAWFVDRPATVAPRGQRLAGVSIGVHQLEQHLDNRRAVDRDERSFAPPAQIMDLSRDEVLPRPTFALNRSRTALFKR